ncbi:hypothetical protein BJ742DRAFT_817749 [Cladochytrium replicatum]|nr:hypothetical protein BJ742DRAFT_817749 [Cladochytrium replicatum]
MNDWDSDEELRYGTYGEFSRVDSEDNSDDDPDLSGPDLVTTLGGQVSLKGLDIDFDVLPALGKHIVDLIRGEEGIEPTSELRFHCAKALYEFAKMTDSEMTVAEGDYIFVVRIEKSEEEDIVDGRTEDPPPKNGEEDQPNSEAGGPVSKLNESDGSQALSDRWCSIDEVPEALAKSKEKQSLQIVTEPDREEFGAQIRQLIQYQKLYGTGWVTGVKLRVKGKGKAADWGEEVTGKVKITMQDIGLLPDNYLEHL